MFSQKARTPEEKKPPPDAHAGPNADKSSLLVELPNSVNTKPQEENEYEEEEAKSSDSSLWELAGKPSSCRKLADKEKDAAAVGFTAGTAKEEEAAGDAVREEEERGAEEEEEEDAATTDGAQAEEKGAAQPPAAAPPPPEGAAKKAAE